MSAPSNTDIKKLIWSVIVIRGSKGYFQPSVLLIRIDVINKIGTKRYGIRIDVVKGEVPWWMCHCGWIWWRAACVARIVRNRLRRNVSV